MNSLGLVLVYLHMIGYALLLGGAAAQYLTGSLRINPAMVWGSGLALLSGMTVATPVSGDSDYSGIKIATKLLIGVSIFAMVFFSAKRESVDRGHFLAIIGMTLLNMGVAVFW